MMSDDESGGSQLNDGPTQELLALNKKINEGFQAFAALSPEATERLRDFAYRNRQAETGKPTLNYLEEYRHDPEEYQRYKAALNEFPWTGGFIHRAINNLTRPGPADLESVTVNEIEELDETLGQVLLQRFPRLTEEALTKVLSECGLRFKNGKDVKWLLRAVKYALHLPVRERQRKTNLEVKKRLQNISKNLGKMWKELADLRRDEEDFLRSFELRSNQKAGEPIDFGRNRFIIATGEIDWLRRFLLQASNQIASERSRRNLATDKDWRIDCAYGLSLFFEEAFIWPTSVSPPESAKRPSLWMKFYASVMELAFGENVIPNQVNILKTAQRMHRDVPLEPPEWVRAWLR